MNTRTHITFHEILPLIPMRMEMRGERYGQALFNILTLCRPNLAEVLRATPIDPFYADEVGDIDPEVWELLASRWDKG